MSNIIETETNSIEFPEMLNLGRVGPPLPPVTLTEGFPPVFPPGAYLEKLFVVIDIDCSYDIVRTQNAEKTNIKNMTDESKKSLVKLGTQRKR